MFYTDQGFPCVCFTNISLKTSKLAWQNTHIQQYNCSSRSIKLQGEGEENTEGDGYVHI